MEASGRVEAWMDGGQRAGGGGLDGGGETRAGVEASGRGVEAWTEAGKPGRVKASLLLPAGVPLALWFNYPHKSICITVASSRTVGRGHDGHVLSHLPRGSLRRDKEVSGRSLSGCVRARPISHMPDRSPMCACMPDGSPMCACMCFPANPWFRSSKYGIPMYITETGIADIKDDRRAIMIDSYFKAVRM